jgi:uncharacterized protein (UPF0332 family)
LAKHGSDEASLRSSISRAYYAAFWIARDLVSRKSRTAIRGHAAIWRMLKDLDPSAADAGDRLRRRRNDADYEKVVPDLGRRAEEALAIADRIIKKLAPAP